MLSNLATAGCGNYFLSALLELLHVVEVFLRLQATRLETTSERDHHAMSEKSTSPLTKCQKPVSTNILSDISGYYLQQSVTWSLRDHHEALHLWLHHPVGLPLRRNQTSLEQPIAPRCILTI